MTAHGSWQIDGAAAGRHVHVAIRSPGPAGNRPLVGMLIVDVEDWPTLRTALAELPGCELTALAELPGPDVEGDP